MKIQCSFLYSHFYMLMFCILIQGMETNLETDNLLYFFSNPMHPLLQALNTSNVSELQEIIDNGNFNPTIKIYDGNGLIIDPISYIAIQAYPYKEDTYQCIDMLNQAGVPINISNNIEDMSIIQMAFDEKMFSYALSKHKTISGQTILEMQLKNGNSTEPTLFQNQCVKLAAKEIKALYTLYTPCFQKVMHNNRTVFHLIIEYFIKESLYALLLKKGEIYSKKSSLLFFLDNLEHVHRNKLENYDCFFKNLYETYCFLESTKQVDPKAPDESNFSPYQSLMWLLTKVYHVQDKYSAILNAPYPPFFHYHWILEKLIAMKNEIKEKALLKSFFENSIKFAQLIAPLEDRPLPTIEDLENKTYL